MSLRACVCVFACQRECERERERRGGVTVPFRGDILSSYLPFHLSSLCSSFQKCHFATSSLKEFLPQSYVRATKIEKKIFVEHKKLMATSEVDAKVKYVKLARGLPTFGVHFFLVKVTLTLNHFYD